MTWSAGSVVWSSSCCDTVFAEPSVLISAAVAALSIEEGPVVEVAGVHERGHVVGEAVWD
jgi:hypothetical protein